MSTSARRSPSSRRGATAPGRSCRRSPGDPLGGRVHRDQVVLVVEDDLGRAARPASSFMSLADQQHVRHDDRRPRRPAACTSPPGSAPGRRPGRTSPASSAAGPRSAKSFTSLPRLVVRSVMPPVGRPPDQTSASIVPAFIASTDSGRPSRWRGDVLGRVEAGGLEQAPGDHLGAGVRRAGGDPLALQVGDRLDPGRGPDGDLGVVVVEPGQRATSCGVLKLSLPFDGVGGGVGEGEGDVVVRPPTRPWMFCTEAPVALAVAR